MFKDEAEEIERCLLSLVPLVDHVVLLDTGSSDDSIAIAENTLKKASITYDLLEMPFTTYGECRTFLVERARQKADWVLMTDADCTIEGTFNPPAKEIGLVEYINEELVSRIAVFLKSSIPWRYEGKELHEYVTSDVPHAADRLKGILMKHHGKSGDTRDTENDLEILQELAEAHPDNERWVFYVAQTLKVLGRKEEAIEMFRQCAAMGNDLRLEWVWYSMYQAAILARDPQALLAACQLRPTRAEAPYALACLLGEIGRYDLALPFAKIASELPEPSDAMYINRPIYVWGGLLEYSMALAMTGHFSQAQEVNEKLLALDKLPEVARREIIANSAAYPTEAAV